MCRPGGNRRAIALSTGAGNHRLFISQEGEPLDKRLLASFASEPISSLEFTSNGLLVRLRGEARLYDLKSAAESERLGILPSAWSA